MSAFSRYAGLSDSISDLNIINQASKPYVIIKRLLDIKIPNVMDILTFNKEGNPYSHNSLLSYSYSRSIDNLDGNFTVRFKDEIINGQTVFDSILPLDIVYIYKNNSLLLPDFIGIVHTKHVSATIGSDGKVKKEVSISGKSIVSLFNDFFINLSYIGTQATNTDAADFLVKNTFFTVSNNNNQIKLEAKSMKEVVDSVWESFSSYSEKLENVSNTDILKIIKALNIKIECQPIPCKYPITTNLYSDGEITFIGMLQSLFPHGAYEIYERDKALVIRETPFTEELWNGLNHWNVKPHKLIEYDFTQSDNEVYSVFMADIEGCKAINTSYDAAKLGANSQGFVMVEKDMENLKKYGYRLCSVTFLGYAQNPNLDNEKTIFKSLNEQLKEMYSFQHKTFSGRIKVIDEGECPKIGEKLNFITHEGGSNLQTTSFYIIQESHSWNYSSSATVDYTLSRGAVYNKSGKFDKTPVRFGTCLENQVKG